MSFAANTESHAWWASLRHEGLLLDEKRLRALFPDPLPPLSDWQADRLRKALVTFQASPADTSVRTALITALLEETIGLSPAVGGTWSRGPAVPAACAFRSVTGETLKPSHLWSHPAGQPLPVFSSADSRLGTGHGKRTTARVMEWLRASGHRLALLTNGHQWRLIYARGDTSAWCEADSSQWFSEGRPAYHLDALRLLLAPACLLDTTPGASSPAAPLLDAIEASRRGQSELSAVLGERVRLAVEKLIASHGPAFLAMPDRPDHKHIYIAACRIILRQVFTLFAEARDLLPRSNPVYWDAYSLGGLMEQLGVGAGTARDRLRHRFAAWPRIIALGRLVHSGSPHEALPLLPYGGELFAPGDPASPDPLRRALAVFESACFDPAQRVMPDSEVLEILTLITRTRVTIRQGRGNTAIDMPVDFSDLSSEYIGILYEGLLDYELRTVSTDESAILFLAIGHEPALPLSRLEQMDDDALKGLVDAFKKAAKANSEESGDSGSDEDPASGDNEDTAPADDDDAAAIAEDDPDAADADTWDDPGADDSALINDDDAGSRYGPRESAMRRARAWARRAVLSSGLVPKPKRGKKSDADAARKQELLIQSAARSMIRRLVLPGEWYLVRWGGTRKGSGSFYTRPGLAAPTIRRTLEPLAYTRDALGQLVPRSPEEILALKICDPACGSGTFPVGAVRYLAQALFLAVFHHHWLEFTTVRQPDGEERETLRLGAAATHSPEGSIPPVLATLVREVRLGAIADEARLHAWLRRAVVESCIYGVDLDPLAIELARLALWIETMDPSLPFTFLDHKFRPGNGLVGGWLDTFQHYPVMAWLREGGDKSHTNFHHHFREKAGKKGPVRSGDVWTAAIKDRLDSAIRPALVDFITESTAPSFAQLSAIFEPDHLLDSARDAFARIHAKVDDPVAQRDAFHAWLTDPHYLRLRDALDLWCALWFWPADRLALAPGPREFANPSDEAMEIARDLRRAHAFFHWELEFPDVFGPGTRQAPAGFHAILGNPPWEIQKPNSKEFFSNVDPLYRAYGKVEAVAKQVEHFTANRAVEDSWLAYNARLKALSHFTKLAAFPFGDPKDHDNDAFHFTLVPRRANDNAALHARWRPKRTSLACFADPAHPFRHQGSADINTYKLFCEQAHALLRPSGRLGFLVPSGIYSDKGSATLRRLFLDHCRWEWCFGFENRDKIFDIDSRFKFAAIIVQKDGTTAAVRTAFMRRKVDDWDSAAEATALDYPRELVTKLSPFSTALVEIRDSRDTDTLERIYSSGIVLGDEDSEWRLSFGREFHMTDDAKLFPGIGKWQALGFVEDEFGHWLKGNWTDYTGPVSSCDRPHEQLLSSDASRALSLKDCHEIAIPLYQGVMMNQFDPSACAWISGSGLNAKWTDITWEKKRFAPQFLIDSKHCFGKSGNIGDFKVCIRSIARTTDQRTMIAAAIPGFPTGNACPVFQCRSQPVSFASSLNGFCFDYVLRLRVGGTNLNYFILAETILPRLAAFQTEQVAMAGAALSLGMRVFAREWISLRETFPIISKKAWQASWAITYAERLRQRCILEAVLTHELGLDTKQFAWIMADCDYPTQAICTDSFSNCLDPKGFWRVDKEKDPELRHTVLAQVAYADLCARGLEAFLAGPDGDGWQLPETLRLADYGLGHDDRAKVHQPVASRLGPRFLDWQLDKDPAQSWAECEAHAAQLDALWQHARHLAGMEEEATSTVAEAPASDQPQPARKPKNDAQLDLF